jgi:hypothetical protein
MFSGWPIPGNPSIRTNVGLDKDLPDIPESPLEVADFF